MASSTPFIAGADTSSVCSGDLVVEVEHVSVSFPSPEGTGEVVRDVSFSINAGERVGLVGESGSGKSLTARAMMRLIPKPGRMSQGRVLLEGVELGTGSTSDPGTWRGSSMAMITQDPLSSLNPLVRIGVQVTEMLHRHKRLGRREARARAVELLASVGIPDPQRALSYFPAVLSEACVSGGACHSDQLRSPASDRRRTPTSLDVTIQAQVLDLLERITAQHGTGVLLISHDLGVVADFCDRLLVMYGGRIVESGPTFQVIDQPAHPYTRALMASVPPMSGQLPARLASIPGSPPIGGVWSTGCSFRAPVPDSSANLQRRGPSARDPRPTGSCAACHATHDPQWHALLDESAAS